jgi:lauroyl/myristoyl acyltransferase
MSLSKFLQSEDIMSCTRKGDPKNLLDTLCAKGDHWYNAHPEEVQHIRSNLEIFGFPSDSDTVARFQHHLILHYFEKLLGICLPPSQYRHFLHEKIIDSKPALDQIKTSLRNGHAIMLASCHYGSIELSTPFLASHGLPMNTVLRFTTEALSTAASHRADQLMSEADFARIAFIQIGRPGTAAAMEMAAALRRKEILLTIFDEKTEYSREVTLLGKKVWGGAGIDRIIRFSGTDLDIFTIYMQRLDNGTYRLILDKIDAVSNPDTLLRSMYASLEQIVTLHPEQWYFLHEEIPFVSGSL